MAKPSKFRKKPVVIEAMQFNDADPLNGVAPIRQWLIDNGVNTHRYECISVDENGFCLDKGHYLVIPTLEGDMRADDGDWIIRGVAGEFYPCKPDIFEKTYEAVEEGYERL